MLRFCFTKVLLNIGVKSQLISDGLSYKLEHNDTYWRLHPQRLRDVHINLEMNKLQNNPLSKTIRKWKYLQSLKLVIIIIIVSLNDPFCLLHVNAVLILLRHRHVAQGLSDIY